VHTDDILWTKSGLAAFALEVPEMFFFYRFIYNTSVTLYSETMKAIKSVSVDVVLTRSMKGCLSGDMR